MSRPGRLIGLGVGPGDPELMTVKGMRALERVAAVAFIAAPGRPSRARAIAAPFLRPETRELIAIVPMTRDLEATGAAYAGLAAGIAGETGCGRDVVFLCEGDPLLYGSFANLIRHVDPATAIEAIPGITAMAAAAALTRTPLAVGEEPLVVIPSIMADERLDAALAQADRVVLLKVGRHLDRVRAALGRAGMDAEALLVENVGMTEQRVRPLADVPEAPYFSLVIAGRPRR